jgi:hypothetical protein
VDGQEDVRAVVFAGEQRADLLGVDLRGELLQVAADLGERVEVPLAQQFEEDLDVVQAQFDRFPEVEFDQQAVALARDGGGGRRVAPEGRFGDLGVQGLESLPQSREVKGASSGRQPSRGPRRSALSTRVRFPSPPCHPPSFPEGPAFYLKCARARKTRDVPVP